jgi:hypothetical protein
MVNIYVCNVGAHNFIKQTLLDIKGQLRPNTIIVNDFNTPYSCQWICHPDKKINKVMSR